MNVNLDRIALELGRAILARILAEQRADEAEQKLAEPNGKTAEGQKVA